MTAKQIILDMFKTGHGITTGSANDIQGYSSGGQRLREIIRDNPKKYCYVMIKGKGNAEYKVFHLRIGRMIKVVKSPKGYRLACSIGQLSTLYSKEVSSRKKALELIKKCGVR